MRVSGMCSADVHEGCPPHGRLKRANGQKFKCECACHPKESPKPPKEDDYSEESDDSDGDFIGTGFAL